MTSVQNRRRLRRERPSVAPSVALSVDPFNSVYLLNQMTNCLTSLLDPQEQNLPPLTPLLLLLMSPSIPRITCRGFLRLFWRLKLPLPLQLQLLSLPRHLGRSWRPMPQTYTMESPTWTATTSVSKARTILLTLELRGLSGFLLPRFSFGTRSVSASSNTSGDLMQTLLCRLRRRSSRRSSAGAWVTPKPL